MIKNIFWGICITLPTLIQLSAGSSNIPEGRLVCIMESDTTKAKQTIQQFLFWYKKNYWEVNKTGLSFVNKKGCYEVDTAACARYLDVLMGSGYLSFNYKKLWQDYFFSKAEWWKTNPQSEGPPEGFDYDLVLLTQEPELFFDKPDTLTYKVEEITPTLAVISVKADWTLYFELTYAKGKWKIDYISGEGFD